MARRTVFIPELNQIGLEIDFNLITNDIESFLRSLNKTELKRILWTQLKNENFESAELVKSYINFKK